MKKKTACQRMRDALPALLVEGYVAASWKVHGVHAQWCPECARLAFAHFAVWAELGAWPEESVRGEIDGALHAAMVQRHARPEATSGS